jgi:stress-induced morphogen
MKIEDKITDYITNYFTPSELNVMKKSYIHQYTQDDTTINDPEYLQLVDLYSRLLEITDRRYRIEVDESCRKLIRKVFNTYISKDTFIITTVENHTSIQDLLSVIDNKKIYRICVGANEQESKDLYNNILKKYRESGCNNVFVLIPGVVPGFSTVFDQNIIYNMKVILDKLEIPNIFVLDDCQGAFFNKRDYSIYDMIFLTAHTIFLGFNMGILLTKLKEKIGYINKTGLKRFGEKLEILIKHKDKALQFNSLMNEYFESEFGDICKKSNTNTQQYFVTNLNNIKIPRKYIDELESKYLFMFNEANVEISWFRIRYQEAIIQKPERFLEGLKKTKKVFKALNRYKDLKEEMELTTEQVHRSIDTLVEDNFEIENAFYEYKDKNIIEQAKFVITSRILEAYKARSR